MASIMLLIKSSWTPPFKFVIVDKPMPPPKKQSYASIRVLMEQILVLLDPYPDDLNSEQDYPVTNICKNIG